MSQSPADSHDPNQNVVVLMSDMVQYAQQTSLMKPEELKDFIIDYHHTLLNIIQSSTNAPVDMEASGGDGSLVVFKKQNGENDRVICTRAVQTALKIAEAIEEGLLPRTRMGLFLGKIIEAELFGKVAKFSTCFAVANRLEELCGHFGTTMLMDREVARNQTIDKEYLVIIGKFSLTSVRHPMNAYTMYKPGIHGCPQDIDNSALLQFIHMKNEAMDLFSGNLLTGVMPDFPTVRNKLIEAQSFFVELTGQEDIAIARILEYIRETPYPAVDFNSCGMKLMEKKRDSLGDRLFLLSKQLLKAMNHGIYQTLVVDTEWEKYFRLEWHKKDSIIIKSGDSPDGIYYLDTGTASTYDDQSNLLSTIESGDIFGEMAYFGNEEKRTATVIADTDVVVRKISTEDFRNLPVIIEIFEKIAQARQEKLDKLHSGAAPDKGIKPNTQSTSF